MQQKLDNISQQREHGEMLLIKLKSCQEYARDTLCSGSEQEIMMKKNEIMGRLSAATEELPLQELQLKEKANVAFQSYNDIIEKCSRIGEVSIENEIANVATCNIVKLHNSCKVASVDKLRTIDITLPDHGWLKRSSSSLSCRLVSDKGVTLILYKVKHISKSVYRISFIPTRQGHHCINVQFKGVNIPSNPYTIQAFSSPATTCRPIKSIQNLRMPHGMAFTPNGLMLVAEYEANTIAVINKDGLIIKRFQQQGGGHPTDVCITPDNHILVLSSNAPHITKYTMDYTVVSMANTICGNRPMEFESPQGIAVSDSGTRAQQYDNYQLISQLNFYIVP